MSSLPAEAYAIATNEPLLLREADEKYGRRRAPDRAPTPEAPPCLPVAAAAAAPQKPRLRDQLIEALRVRHYSIRTEEAYASAARGCGCWTACDCG
jgi:hypothetical protein